MQGKMQFNSSTLTLRKTALIKMHVQSISPASSKPAYIVEWRPKFISLNSLKRN